MERARRRRHSGTGAALRAAPNILSRAARRLLIFTVSDSGLLPGSSDHLITDCGALNAWLSPTDVSRDHRITVNDAGADQSQLQRRRVLQYVGRFCQYGAQS